MNAADIDIALDDAYLDIISCGGTTAPDDHLGALLAAWRVEHQTPPTPRRVDSNTNVHDPAPSGALRWAVVAFIVLAVILVLVLAGCTPGPVPPASTPTPTVGACRADKPGVCPGREIPLGTIAPPYTPTSFPKNWGVVHGCTTRQIVIANFSGDAAVDTDGDGCRDNGVWTDPYTGLTITAASAQIDHVYSKEEAWRRGAWRWTTIRRAAFYNYQPNLLPVSSHANEAKGSKGPDTWRPPNRGAWCQYATVYEATAVHWSLEVTLSEQAAIDDMKSTCGVAQPR
jgi:hypothetical protein